MARDRARIPTRIEETLYLPQRAAGRVIFVHRALAADLYWIRAVQYFGNHPQMAQAAQRQAGAGRRVSFDELYPLLDITTTLDPLFNIAYRFGAIFLAPQYPQGAGRPDLAVALLEKGIKASPQKWQYWEDIGFVYYWDVHDYLKASAALQRGADLPGAPWWVRSMAATMLVRGGDRTTSKLLWRQLLETANNEYAREAARNKLMQLQAIEEIERLQPAINRVLARSTRPISGWGDLLAAGVLRGVPVDPSGEPYRLTSEGRVEVAPTSRLFPLPAEPQARPGA
jgi:tetratricopeptide (TPR) repeat protein